MKYVRIAEIDSTLKNKFVQIYSKEQQDLAKERKALVFEEKQLIKASEKIASNLDLINASRTMVLEDNLAPIQRRMAELVQEFKSVTFLVHLNIQSCMVN